MPKTAGGLERSGDPAGGAPRVGVVLLICRAEEESLTLDCIESLQSSTHPSIDVILVDNGAPEGVARRILSAYPDVTLLSTGANLGFTGGNNRGIDEALATGVDYVLVLNNDTIVEPDCIARLVETAETEGGVGAVGGKILYGDDPNRIWFAGGTFLPARGLGRHRGEGEIDRSPRGSPPEPVEEVSFLTGCCMLFPAAVLREVGGFEEDFMIYVEDVEISVRLRAAGYRLLYDPAARLYHRIPVEEPPIPPHKIVLRDRNRRRLMRRRFGALARLRFSLFFYPTRLVHAARYVAQGDRARVAATWRGMTEP